MGFMSPNTPKKPPPPVAPPPVPTLDDARQRQMASDRRARSRGRGAAMLSGEMGDLTQPRVAPKMLLGQ